MVRDGVKYNTGAIILTKVICVRDGRQFSDSQDCPAVVGWGPNVGLMYIQCNNSLAPGRFEQNFR